MKKEKYNELIMVIKRNNLFRGDDFQGFKGAEGINFQERILNNYNYVKRGEAENCEELKQPIGYSVLVNREGGVFAYQRAKNNDNYTEKRLQGKWSWGVGGHIDKQDDEGKNPIKASTMRELREEVNVDGKIKKMGVLGYINDDSDSVGRVHFGILYMVKINGSVEANDNEITNEGLRSVSELKQIIDDESEDVEEWSKIALELLEEIL